MKAKQKIKEIYVSDASYDVTEEDLRKLFAVCGTVRAVQMMTDPRSGRFTGRAYIRMANEAENRDAINMLDGTRLLDRCIKVCATRQKKPLDPAPVSEDKPIRKRQRPKRQRK